MRQASAASQPHPQSAVSFNSPLGVTLEARRSHGRSPCQKLLISRCRGTVNTLSELGEQLEKLLADRFQKRFEHIEKQFDRISLP